MESQGIAKTIIQQMPYIMMSMNNSTSSWTIALMVLVPVLMYLVDSWPRLRRKFRIPWGYVYYVVTDESCSHPTFSRHVAEFLDDFDPSVIKYGEVKFFNRDRPHKTSTDRSYIALACPDRGFHGRITITADMVAKLRKLNAEYPLDHSPEDLKGRTFYFTLFIDTKKVKQQGLGGVSESEQENRSIQVAGPTMPLVKCLVYIIVNYYNFKQKSDENFLLQKTAYYMDGKVCRPSYTNVYLNKTYQNVFLSEANHILVTNSVTQWVASRGEQLQLGIPNKLGLFLVGTPGCGKSSLIYAIANETRKRIVSVNLKDFSNTEFIRLMQHIENSVVVFDDIDAHVFVHKRETTSTTIQKETTIEELAVAIKGKEEIEKPKLTLDLFLEVLDGYCYLSNCVVILTSNHPEVIDPAVIRPGRLDHTIHFDLCDTYQFERIFSYFVGRLYTDFEPDFQFQSNLISTSYLINTVVLPNRSSPKRIFELLDPATIVQALRAQDHGLRAPDPSPADQPTN